jgi:predicted phage baseplate assembly protein
VPLSGGEWKAQTTLLSSNATATHFVVETNNDGRAMIRFGDGVAGMLPPDGALLRATYRVGVGTSGNVAPGALAHVVADGALPIDAVRNPLASWGGVAPEDLDEVRLTAPAAMRAHSERAVTEDDYARAAMRHPLVANAVATFRWTGTWHTVFVTVDPKGRADLTDELQESVREWLTRYVQTGYDLEIDPPRYVPVELEVDVCVAPGHFRTHVEQAIASTLSAKGGFFDPDRFSFGEPLYLSQVYAAIAAVEGVSAAEVTAFHRYGDPPAGELARGAIAVGRTEVIRLDNDPNFPDNGLLKLSLRSGK